MYLIIWLNENARFEELKCKRWNLYKRRYLWKFKNSRYRSVILIDSNENPWKLSNFLAVQRCIIHHAWAGPMGPLYLRMFFLFNGPYGHWTQQVCTERLLVFAGRTIERHGHNNESRRISHGFTISRGAGSSRRSNSATKVRLPSCSGSNTNLPIHAPIQEFRHATQWATSRPTPSW